MLKRAIFFQVLAASLLFNVGAWAAAEESVSTEANSAAQIDKAFSLRSGYWTSSRQLDDEKSLLTGSVWGRVNYQPSAGLRLAFDGWVGTKTAAGDGPKGQVRELYADVQATKFDVRLGRQIIAWGRADALNPTDNLSPRRYTMLVSEDDEQRIGIWAAKASMHIGELALTGIYEPRFTPTEIPLRRTSNVRFIDEDSSSKRSWALKLEREGGKVDWSVSLYDGPDRPPSFSPVSISPAGIVLQEYHRRIRVLGADWATTSGAYAFRGEAAYMHPHDEYAGNPFAKKPFFYAVQGVERQLPNSSSLIVQGFYKQIYRFEDFISSASPAFRPVLQRTAAIMDQADARKYGWTMRLAKRWANDTIETEIAALMSYPRHDHLVRAKLTYRLTDELKLVTGLDVLRGPEESFYGQLKDNSAYYATLEFHF